MESEESDFDVEVDIEAEALPLIEKPSRGTRFRRSLTARLGRTRIKRVRALIKKREDRLNEKRLKIKSRETRPDI